MPAELTAADYDEFVGESFDALPRWVLDALGDVIVRVEQRVPGDTVDEAHRLTLYRERALGSARDRDELRQIVRSELARTIVLHLDLDPSRVGEIEAVLEPSRALR